MNKDPEVFGSTVREEQFLVGKKVLLLREPSAFAAKEIKHLLKKHIDLLTNAPGKTADESIKLGLADIVTECVDDVAAIVFDVEENQELTKMNSHQLRAWVRNHLAAGSQSVAFVAVLLSMIDLEALGKQVGTLQEKLMSRMVSTPASAAAETPQTTNTTSA